MKKLLLLLLITCSGHLQSQTISAELFELNFSGDSYPKELTPAANKVFFTALDLFSERNLWVHDIVSGTTYKVKNTQGESLPINNYGNLTMVGDILYFISNYNAVPALWRSNGTPEGTYLVKDIAQGSFINPSIYNLTACNGILYFTASDQANGSELWKSDGTSEGTIMVKDINPGTQGSAISNIIVFNNIVFFKAQTPTYGLELWKSDGTAEGTQLVKDIAAGGGSSGFSALEAIVAADGFYFLANDGTNGNELWKSDGTSAGTYLFKEFVSGFSGISAPMAGIAVDDYFLFSISLPSGTRQLWKSNGTLPGTILLRETAATQGGVAIYSQFCLLDGTIYFTQGSYYDAQWQLWKTDGTVAGTQQVIDLQPNMQAIAELTAAQDFLIFISRSGEELVPWISDGTAEGTQQLHSVGLSTTSAGEVKFTPIGGLVFFQGNSGELHGMELWQTDGTTENTRLTKDIFHRYAGLTLRGGNAAAILNEKMIFMGRDGVEPAMPYTSNGTAEGTYKLNPGGPVSISSEDDVNSFVKAGNRLFFAAYQEGFGYEMASTDGTSAGTSIVKNIAPGTASSINEYPYTMEYNGIVYFKANDQLHGSELWRSDGTEAGTYMVKDIYPGSQSGVVASNGMIFQQRNYAVFNGLLYFMATDANGPAIWSTDGSETGTTKVITLAGGPVILGATDSKLFFATNTTGSTYGVNTLWSSNGTQTGSIPLMTYNESEATQFRYSCILENEIYYGIYNNETALSLAKSDGTVAGTVIVKGFLGGGDFRNFQYLKPCGSFVYFAIGTITGSEFGDDLWRSDGTENGTVVIADQNMSPDFFAVREFNCYNNDLLFIQDLNTTKIYVTNGNPEETYDVDVSVTGDPDFGSYLGLDGILGITEGKIYLEGITEEGGSELYIGSISEILGTGNAGTGFKTNNSVSLYPNPTTKSFTVSSQDATLRYLEIYDISGKKIFSTEAYGSSFTLEMPEVSKGIYFVKVKTDNSVITKKLIRN